MAEAEILADIHEPIVLTVDQLEQTEVDHDPPSTKIVTIEQAEQVELLIPDN